MILNTLTTRFGRWRDIKSLINDESKKESSTGWYHYVAFRNADMPTRQLIGTGRILQDLYGTKWMTNRNPKKIDRTTFTQETRSLVRCIYIFTCILHARTGTHTYNIFFLTHTHFHFLACYLPICLSIYIYISYIYIFVLFMHVKYKPLSLSRYGEGLQHHVGAEEFRVALVFISC